MNRYKITETMASCEEKKINGYMMSIEDLKTMINRLTSNRSTIAVQKISNMVPLGTNYLNNRLPLITKTNNVKCVCFNLDDCNNLYNSQLTVTQHIEQKDIKWNDYVVLRSDDFEIIKQIVLTSSIHLHFGYFECIYDRERSNEKTYKYPTKICNLVKLLGSEDLTHINKLLSINPIEVCATGKKKDEPYLAETYEVLYATTMTLGEHIKMYQRDQNICNYNTVNHGIGYEIALSQEQYDLLSASMLSDDPSFEICLRKDLVDTDTNAMIFLNKEMLFLSSSQITILNGFPVLKNIVNNHTLRQLGRDCSDHSSKKGNCVVS
jgi:hypothetical protein